MTEHEIDPIQRLWKAQSTEPLEVDMNRIRQEAEALDRTVQSRNRRERLVAWPLAAFFAVVAVAELGSGNAISAAGALLTSLSMLWIVYALGRFGAGRDSALEVDRDGASFLAQYRRELEQQRRLLLGAWLWYCLPVIAGLLLLDLGRVMENGGSLAEWLRSPRFLITAAIGIAVALANLIAARDLGRRLNELGG